MFFDRLMLPEHRSIYVEHIQKKYCEKELSFIREYILSSKCTDDLLRLQKGDYFFNLPIQKIVIRSGKVRELYPYTESETLLLSMIRYFLHEYDAYLSDDVYSHILNKSATLSMKKICTTPGIHKMYAYRTDIKDYSRHIDGERLKGILKKLLGDDEALYQFLCYFIDEKRYVAEGEIRQHNISVTQGTPLTGFFENIYLSEFDVSVASVANVYCRYVDDMIVYADSEERLGVCREHIQKSLKELKLSENVKKTKTAKPGEVITYLGISFCGSKRSIGEERKEQMIRTIRILTKRMLKVRERWNLSSDVAIRLMIKTVDGYLSTTYAELYTLTEIDALREIDHAVQDALRIVGSQKKSKKRYIIRYKKLNELGYKSLVCRYYKSRNKRRA